MSKNTTTSKVIDEVLRFGVTGSALTLGILVPNLLIALDKPLAKLWHRLDKREKERELRRIVYTMKANGYLAGDYEHGLQLTEKARKRLAKVSLDDLQVHPQEVWDKKWRIIIYDIPENHKKARNALTQRLRNFGCFQLQKSAWITPFPCRDDIETITANFKVNQYVTYFEATYLDNAKPLLQQLSKKYPHTKFQ